MAGLKNSSRSFLMARHTPPMSVPRHHADGRGTSDHGKECLTYLVIIFKITMVRFLACIFVGIGSIKSSAHLTLE